MTAVAPAEMLAPDLSEAIVGWRFWDAATVAGETRLRSLYQPCAWPVGAPLVAECRTRRLVPWPRRGHVAPVESCRCGIYATSREALARLLEAGLAPPDWLPVIGTVSLWGRVVECERGWRSSHAYPVRLWVPGWACVAEPLARRLEVYGVPAAVLAGRTLHEAIAELVAA